MAKKKTIKIPCLGIEIILSGKKDSEINYNVEPDLIAAKHLDADPESVDDFWQENSLYVDTACAPFMELIKNLALMGFDVTSPEFVGAIEASKDTLFDKFFD